MLYCVTNYYGKRPYVGQTDARFECRWNKDLRAYAHDFGDVHPQKIVRLYENETNGWTYGFVAEDEAGNVYVSFQNSIVGADWYRGQPVIAYCRTHDIPWNIL